MCTLLQLADLELELALASQLLLALVLELVLEHPHSRLSHTLQFLCNMFLLEQLSSRLGSGSCPCAQQRSTCANTCRVLVLESAKLQLVLALVLVLASQEWVLELELVLASQELVQVLVPGLARLQLELWVHPRNKYQHK